jgi:hypothetical protein
MYRCVFFSCKFAQNVLEGGLNAIFIARRHESAMSNRVLDLSESGWNKN